MLKVDLLNEENLIVKAGKTIITKAFGESLKTLVDNLNTILNDTILNRLMRELDYQTIKGMSSSATSGLGASAGYFIIKGSTICRILQKQIDDKKADIILENSKSNPNNEVIKSIEVAIESLTDYINYFTPKVDFYFIVNGQHRYDSIKKDCFDDVKKPKAKKASKKAKKGNKKVKSISVEEPIRYSDLEVTIDGETYRASIESLYDLKQKLTSVFDEYRFDWAKELSKEKRELIYNSYLESCQIYIYEIVDAVSFSAVMEFVRKSNQSTEWDDFLFKSIQSMSPYTKWFRNNCISEKTNELSAWEKLFYTKGSAVQPGMVKGSFSRTGGGWQYFIGNLMTTCYAQPSANLPIFKVVSKTEIDNILFQDGSPFLEEWGELLLTDISKIVACINQLAEQPNSKIFTSVYQKASFVIYCLYAYNYYSKFYTIRNGKDKYKLNIQDNNLFEFVKSMCIVCFMNSQITTDENTNFWKTEDGKKKIDEWKKVGALVKPSQEHPIKAKDLLPEYQSEWGYILQQCEKNETKDKEKSFGRHFIGDLISWGSDHSCVVNRLNETIQNAFSEVMIDCKPAKAPFASIGFVSISELPAASELVSSDYEELTDLLNSDEETDRAHTKARANGGASDVSNINLGNRNVNRKQKAVV